MHDVFISYSTKNQFEADLVRRVVKTNGFSCWMAPESIPVGSNYAKEIPAGIRDARVVVLILSQMAQESIWVTREIDLAVSSGKVIIPFAVEDCALKDAYNFYLAGSERVEAYQRRSEALELLIQRIGAIVLDEIPPVVTSAESIPEQPITEEPRAVPDYELTEYVKAFIRSSVIAGHQDYRNQNVAGLRKYLQIPAEDEVFLAHDDTLLHSGRIGFALCTSGIYCTNIIKEQSYMSWENFLRTECFEFLKSELYAVTPDGYVMIAYLNAIEKQCISMLIRFMEQLRDAMIRTFGMQERFAVLSVHEDSGNVSNADLAGFVRTFTQSSVIAGHQNYRNQNVAGLRKYLQIPAEDEVFLAHDDTVLHSGKNGFALCTSGIYCTNCMKKQSYMSWENFLRTERFESLESELYAVTPGGSTMIGYLNLLDDRVVSMQIRFMEQLRDSMIRTFGIQEHLPGSTVHKASKEVSEAELSEFAKFFSQSSEIASKSNYQNQDTGILRKKLGIPEKDEIFLAHIDTDSEKCGFVLCTSGIYCSDGIYRHHLEWTMFLRSKQFVYLSETQLREADTDSPHIFKSRIYRTKSAHVTKLYGVLSESMMLIGNLDSVDRQNKSMFAGFLEQLWKAMRQNFDEATDEELVEFVKCFTRSNELAGHPNYQNQNLDGLRKYLQIPAEDEVFLAHDESSDHSGINGFVMSESGIHCCDGVYLTSLLWKTFFRIERFAFLTDIIADDFAHSTGLMKNNKTYADVTNLYAVTPAGVMLVGYLNTADSFDKLLLLRFMEQLQNAMRKKLGT